MATSSHWHFLQPAGIALAALCCTLCCACPFLKPASSPGTSSSNQSAASQPGSSAAAAQAQTSPAFRIDNAIRRELPLEQSMQIEWSHTDDSGNISLMAASGMDTLQTCTFLIAELGRLGYESDDNASRILEGVHYRKTQGRIRDLFVHVTMDNDGKCRVEMKSSGGH
ncbi:MAG: hypothetical protein R3F46_10650 [bacterium]